MYYLVIIMFIIIAISMYKRHYPIHGILCVQSIDRLINEDIIIIDLRDYNEADHSPISGSLNIPLAYVKRFYKDIPKQDVHIVAENKLDCNLGLRFLQRNGIKVKSYSIIACNCEHNQDKEVFRYGV